MQIGDRVAVITGGASGLGAANVQLLAEAGAHVAIFDVNPEAGRRLAATYKERALFVNTDVANAADTATALQQVQEKFGAVHILINCAGIGTPGRVVSNQWC